MRLAALALFVAVSLCLPGAAPARDVPLPLTALRDRTPGEIEAGQVIEFHALARYSGEELKLFHSKRGEQLDLIYPYCISANSAAFDYPDRQALDGKWLRVAGTLIDADELGSRRQPLFLTTPDGVRFRNDCFGAYVLRTETAEPVDPAPYAPRECLPNTGPFCLPREYDDYWVYSGMQMRVPAPKLQGPVTIYVSATDHFFAQPVAGTTRRTIGDYTVFFTVDCPSDTECTLTAASLASYGLTGVTPQVSHKPFIRVVGKTSAALEAALATLRYCPGECAAGPSISLAEMKAAED